MTEASEPMSEQSPAVSAPYMSPAKFFENGYKTIVDGTFDISWLRPMLHQYSLPATASLKNEAIFSFDATDEEKTKKHKNVRSKT